LVSTEPRPLDVLLVEDSADDVELVLQALRDGGLTIAPRVVATEAELRSALGTPPDVVLSDWLLPGFSGASALAIVHESAPGVPCILVSGVLGEDLVVEALRHNAVAYVSKSRLGVLAPTVRQALVDAGMRRDRDRKTAAVEQSPDGIVIVDPDLRILYVNPVYAASVGLEPAELAGRSAAEVVSMALDETTVADMTREVTAGHPWMSEVDHHRPDGTVSRFDVAITPLREAKGRISGWLGVIRDVTELRESEQRFRNALSEVPLAAIMMDTGGTVLFVNRYLLELTGWQETEVVGHNGSEFLPPEDRASLREVFLTAIAAGSGPLGRRARLLTRAGEIREIDWSATLLRDRAGAVVAWAGLGTDVTERELAMAALDASEARLRTALDAMIEGVVVVSAMRDESGRIVDFRIDYANEAIGVISGVPPGDQVGHTLLELFPAHRTNGLFEAYCGVVASGIPFESSEFHYVDADAVGGPVDQFVEQQAAKMGDGYVMSVRDVTGRHRAEQQLRRLSAAIDQSADAVMITDASGRIEYVNPAFENVSLYTHEEVLGKNPSLLRSGVQGPAFYAAMWATLAGGTTFVGDLTNRRKDGSLFSEEAVISPIRDADGEISSYVAVKRDVTRERALEADQKRLSRERARIARALVDLRAGPSPEVTAEGICREVAGLGGATSAALYFFSARGIATPLAFLGADGTAEPLRLLPARRSQRLRERAAGGPWVEAWVRRPWHPYDRIYGAMGVRSVAYAPVLYDGELVGLLTIASAEENATSALADALPSLLEFAAVAGPLIGPAVASLTEAGMVRQRITEMIAQRAFHPVFQPIVDLESRETVGFEALTRFSSGQRPDLCFADAWSTGVGPDLELATLAAAVAAGRSLRAGLWLSLNVSPRLLVNAAKLGAVLSDADRPVVLEVTEHEVIENYATARDAVRALGHDVRVAVDDAGAGIANFNHIVDLGPDFVKLDISLVRGVNRDLGRQALVIGMHYFAQSAGCRLVAEGIEDEEEAATLAGFGVELGQGYLFGHPAPAGKWVAVTPARKSADSPRDGTGSRPRGRPRRAVGPGSPAVSNP
jgi:PAS domain S-box-containing protein